MTDRPIIFSAPMIKALLDGRKSQTRRLAIRQIDETQEEETVWCAVKPGDRLYAREAFCHISAAVDPARPVIYRADGGAPSLQKIWKPSIHMPRWASRLTLTVTEVRRQRLQEISEEDARAEGLIAQEGDGGGPGAGYKWSGIGYHGGRFDAAGGRCFHVPHQDGRPGCSCKVAGPSPAQCAFRQLWEALHGAGSWESNPDVIVITFSVERRNIDAPPEVEHAREGRG